MNEQLAFHVIQEAVKMGVSEFCICPGNRNSPFYTTLMKIPSLKKYNWFEERSAAFFALGRCKAIGNPVAVITTSGTAAGELLPAAMEAFYTGIPLLLITADRPRRFRGSGAPQTAEQVGLFGIYAPFSQDIAEGELCKLSEWDCANAAHLNVCFEEPFPGVRLARLQDQPSDCDSEDLPEDDLCTLENQTPNLCILARQTSNVSRPVPHQLTQALEQFLQNVKYPFVVISNLKSEGREEVVDFLLKLNAPVFLEGVSGLRENSRLQHLRITRTDGLWQNAEKSGYSIDGILRIGGVPTFRLWRDIEEKQGKIAVCSISEVPFSGLSFGDVIHTPISNFFSQFTSSIHFSSEKSEMWVQADKLFSEKLHVLFQEEPDSEVSLFHQLSTQIPKNSSIFLGNSLPIREWDLAACQEDRGFSVSANRGLNGIDGQASTFLGMSKPLYENWGILGDLTALYDLAAPWILPQIQDTRVNLVIINNGGGQIFSRFLPEKQFLNAHELEFSGVAKLWSMQYEKWHKIPNDLECHQNRLIEIVPDPNATERFNNKLRQL